MHKIPRAGFFILEGLRFFAEIGTWSKKKHDQTLDALKNFDLAEYSTIIISVFRI